MGRTLLSLVFLLSALGDKIPHYSEVVARMTSEGIPAPHILLAGTYYFHNYWSFDNPEIRQEFFKTFLKNISIIGGLLLVIANGPGPMSLDARKGNDAKDKGYIKLPKNALPLHAQRCKISSTTS